MGFFEKMFAPATPASSGRPETPNKDKEMPMGGSPPDEPGLNEYHDPVKKYNKKEYGDVDTDDLNDGTGTNELNV